MTPVAVSSWLPDTWSPAVLAGAEQLGEALGDGQGATWPVRLGTWSDVGPRLARSLTISSLALDIFPLDRPVAEVAAVWRARLARVPDEDRPRFHLCTIFRAVGPSLERRALLERVRRLNLASIDMSQAFGIGIVDIDRSLTLFGAELAQTDFRLQGVRASEMAGHVIAAALLGSDLCGVVAPERRAQAVQRHGRLNQLAALVDRRLRRVGPARGSRSTA